MMTKQNENPGIVHKLFRHQSADASEESLLFEQYKLYVEMMDKVSERRHQANSFFLTVNTVLIMALTSFISLSDKPTIQYSWMIFASTAGVIFCISWLRLIRSYRELNRGKFKVIHLLETRLPARLFDAEWDALRYGDGAVYKPFSQIEMQIPIVFMFLYGALSAILIWEIFSSA
ncbi:hypothetical protein D6779_05130 [Candidatus Parcubacteria bacterium]|nr:MAG: hypothetical protein D6779_05130 [Candidatus Parcubacteria bacterium]